MFEESRRICLEQGWPQGVHYADDMIIKIYAQTHPQQGTTHEVAETNAAKASEEKIPEEEAPEPESEPEPTPAEEEEPEEEEIPQEDE